MKGKIILKWERDEAVNGYFVMKETSNNLEVLVRIENIDIISIVVTGEKLEEENHFIIYYYKKQNDEYIICRKKDYYGYISGSNYAVYRFPIPKLKIAIKQDEANYIGWEKVSDDIAYLVARRVTGGKWERICVTKNTNYIDKNIDNKRRYIYTVRCISEDGEHMLSSFSKKGVVI